VVRRSGVEFASTLSVMSRNWRCMAMLIVVPVSWSMVSCAHRRGLLSPQSIVESSPAAASALPASGRRAQEAVDEVLKRLKQSDRPRPSSPGPAPSTRLKAEPEQLVGTSGTLPPPAYSVVIVTQPSPSADTPGSVSPQTATNNPIDRERSTGRLRPPAATLIAMALIAAIVWLPRLRHRRPSPPPEAT
jgi:hypothetical protein